MSKIGNFDAIATTASNIRCNVEALTLLIDETRGDEFPGGRSCINSIAYLIDRLAEHSQALDRQLLEVRG